MSQSVCSKCFVKLTQAQRRADKFMCDACEAEWARKAKLGLPNTGAQPPGTLPRAPTPTLNKR
jgi:hypothetical protein